MKTKINIVLVILWAFPIFIFVPAKQEIVLSQVKSRMVNVPGVGEVHFPGMMSDTEIQNAIKVNILKSQISYKLDIIDEIVNEKRFLSCKFFASNEQIGSYKFNYFCYAPLPIILIYGGLADLTIEGVEKKYGNYTQLNVFNPYWKYWLWMITVILAITIYLKRKWFVKLHNLTKASLLLVFLFFVSCKNTPPQSGNVVDSSQVRNVRFIVDSTCCSYISADIFCTWDNKETLTLSDVELPWRKEVKARIGTDFTLQVQVKSIALARFRNAIYINGKYYTSIASSYSSRPYVYLTGFIP